MENRFFIWMKFFTLRNTARLKESAAGSIGQVRQVAGEIVPFAKQRELPVFLVGHVTKDGSLAGPRVLEHMVDTVLYFEGESTRDYRILRSVKNRFGSTNEIGIFEMSERGLLEVSNPSRLFLREDGMDLAGSVVTAAMEKATAAWPESTSCSRATVPRAPPMKIMRGSVRTSAT